MTQPLPDKRDEDGDIHVGETSPDDDFDAGDTGAEARAEAAEHDAE